MRRQPGNKTRLIIIGGGASGLAAACLCVQNGVSVTLLEKESRVGRKLLATGNGRCNIWNTGPPVYFGDEGFAGAVLSHCGIGQVADFWERLGLLTCEEDHGLVYPAARQAASVLDCLRLRLEASPLCEIKTCAWVTGIKKTNSGFTVTTKDGAAYEAPLLLAAPGGPAAPRLGGSDSLLGPLAGLGHRLVPTRPALCPLATDTQPIRGLKGLRLPARLWLKAGGRAVAAASGEALFTDYGVSGLCAMQLARDAGERLLQQEAVTLLMDFSPALGLAPPYMGRLDPEGVEAEALGAGKRLQAMLEGRERRLGRPLMYLGLLPRPMAERLQDLKIPDAAQWLSGLALHVTGIRGFDQAQVAAGGLDCADFDPATLASATVPGLYVAGEALNVDGDCGGFNLLFAWATAILAAWHIISLSE